MNIRKVSYLFVAVTVMSGFSFQPTEADSSIAYSEKLIDKLVAESILNSENKVPEALTRFMESDSTSWGGAFFDNNILIIKYVGTNFEDANESIIELNLSTKYILETSQVSLKTLLLVQKRVVAANIFEVAAFGVDSRRSKVLVGLSSTQNSALNELQKIDSENIEAYKFELLEPTKSRFFESNPFIGGALIATYDASQFSRTAGLCSTGFALADVAGQKARLITAGHCYLRPTGDSSSELLRITAGSVGRVQDFYSGDPSLSDLPPIGNFVGTSLRYFDPVDGVTIINNSPNSTGDWAIVSLSNTNSGPRSTAAEIYVGLGDSQTTKTVSVMLSESWLQQNTDATLYTSGASGFPYGNTGRAKVNQSAPFSQTVIYTDYLTGFKTYVNGLWMGWDSPSGPCVESGDSGGAVYRNLADGSVGAVGIISGRGLFSPGKCFSLFTPISDVVQQYGVNVKVN